MVSGGSGEPATASFEAEPRLIAPDHEAPPKPDAPKPEPPKAEAAKSDAPKAEAPELELPKAEPGAPGKILIMPPGDRSWHNEDRRPEAETAPTGKRRISAMAAVIALAAIAGAISGALATAGMTHFAGKDDSSAPTQGLEASVARIDADLLALKASVEHTSKVAAGQHNKATDRLEKLEKAQAEPAARLARLSDAVEKLRAASAIAPAQNAAAKEVTGSVAPAQLAAAAPATTPASPPVPAAPDTQLGRLPTVQGWVLRDAGRGRALVEGRDGLYEVYAGDPLPGVGRVDAIRRQDGRWVVVTTKGLIVSR
ncbi:hypothetical protein [Bradyrhizobium sp.]|uniref:hypothetical protein n=1 Tax=Bradyrhizobium sp. TaxID=376 RepID=UPI0025C15FC2|nr:hypothetical protein [Bradyrhizobium sp.]